MTVTADAAPATDPSVARAHRALEPLHGHAYFSPELGDRLTGIGLRPGRMPYFAGRAAPMGAVGPGVVTATFYNFNPTTVARFIPRAWTLASPDAIVAARFDAVDGALRRLLDDDVVAGPEVAELLELLRVATAGCRPEARPLFAGHADLDWPAAPHVALWHATALLREHRGDGHLMALQHAGLSGVESIVTHTATGRGFTVEAAKTLRGWSDQEWSAAQTGLAARGLLSESGELTDAGVALRNSIEAETDVLAAAPWHHLGADGTARVIELGRGLSRRTVAAGAYPPGVFS